MSKKDSHPLENRVDAIEKKIDAILESLKDASEIRRNNGTIINNNFELLNSKIDKLSTKVGVLHDDQAQGFDDVKMELVKIQKTTGYEELYANLKVIP